MLGAECWVPVLVAWCDRHRDTKRDRGISMLDSVEMLTALSMKHLHPASGISTQH
jgi:hypothetical protein